MKAGKLNRYVSLQSAVDTQDANTGEPIRTWAVLAQVWAKIEPLKGKEFFNGGILADMDTKITIRWSAGLSSLSAKDRILHQTTIYNIVSISEVSLGHRELQIMCKSGINEG